jgi:hypothetical protein
VIKNEITKTLYTYCEQVGRRRKDYETKNISPIQLIRETTCYIDRVFLLETGFNLIKNNVSIHERPFSFMCKTRGQSAMKSYRK